jgi:DNA-3-methyladenine glycosylase I
MLLKQRILAGLGDGSITLAFRRWHRPMVRGGSQFLSPVGTIAVDEIREIGRAGISERDARQAGFASRAALLDELDPFGPGPIYRISLRLAGPDPRKRLRQQHRLTEGELADVARRLSRLDAASRRGPWTVQTLRLIESKPAVRAADLALSQSLETLDFKRDVRKLKTLGLTESLEIGYQLSPRGRVVLQHLTQTRNSSSPRKTDEGELKTAAKGPTRCRWAQTPLGIVYHDQEWGTPVHDDRTLFEFLTLEGAQAGLSWETILRKRPAYVEAFAGFDPARVAKFTPAKVARLLGNPGIVRNRLKIESAVRNAKAFLAVQREFGSFDAYVWTFVGGSPRVNRWRLPRQVPARTEESDALSRDLKKRGFSFIGSTICYAFMQAVGMVNDHTTDCFRHAGKAKTQK